MSWLNPVWLIPAVDRAVQSIGGIIGDPPHIPQGPQVYLDKDRQGPHAASLESPWVFLLLCRPMSRMLLVRKNLDCREWSYSRFAHMSRGVAQGAIRQQVAVIACHSMLLCCSTQLAQILESQDYRIAVGSCKR